MMRVGSCVLIQEPADVVADPLDADADRNQPMTLDAGAELDRSTRSSLCRPSSPPR